MQYVEQLWSSLFSKSGDIIPRLLIAILILIIGSMMAGFLRRLTKQLVEKTKFDQKLSNSGVRDFSFARLISKVVYYLVMIYVLILVLSQAGVTGALEPLQNMLDAFLLKLPNILGAVLIGVAGYLLGKIASEAIGLLSPLLDKVSQKAGFDQYFSLMSLTRQLVFLIVFIPLLLQALAYLNMTLISVPATEMLEELMGSIPNILAAAILLMVFYIGGKYVVGIITELLYNLGLDDMSKRIGVNEIIGEQASFSKFIGRIAFFFLMFAGVLSAVEKLELVQLTEILNNLYVLSGKIFFGLVILLVGNQVSEWVSNYVGKTETSAMAAVVRFATLGLFLAIALRSMGVANDIVNLAFLLILGSVSVAVALAYGLGGREAAGKHFGDIINRLRK